MGLRFVDAHTHPLNKYYSNNFEVIENAHKKGVVAMLVTGCNLKENEEVKQICAKYDYTHAVIGIHPNEAKGSIDGQNLENQVNRSVVAIGEIGLDYYYPEHDKLVQELSLRSQIEVAQKHNLPVVIHMRDSYEDLYRILSDYPKVKFMIHTFSGNVEWAKKFYKLGCYFSFSGAVTYKKSEEIVQALAWLPLDRILTETDAPYLSPAIKRGEINFSNYVKYTSFYVAGVKRVSVEKLTKQVVKNVKELFKIHVSKKI